MPQKLDFSKGIPTINVEADAKWDWRFLAFNIVILSSLIGVLFTAIGWRQGDKIALLWQTPTPTFTPTATPRPTFTPYIPTPTATAMSGVPTPTGTRVVQYSYVSHTATPVSVNGKVKLKIKLPQLQALSGELKNISPSPQILPSPNVPLPPNVPRAANVAFFTRQSPLVLAHYFAWFDGTGWNDCNISANDKPLHPYASDDPTAIARHVQMARELGLDGFTLHWFTPGDRTDRNFSALLTASQGQNFYSTIVFSRHIYGIPATRQIIVDALRYIIQQYSSRPNFLRVDNKAVLFFTDIYRVPSAAGQTPPQFWASVRDEVDPQRQTIWIAEGLDDSYLSVFDGLYVFKITHATAPDDYRKDSNWAAQVRRWEQQTGQPKLWIATISPGWDDRRAGCRKDVRMPAPAHRRDREDGGYYRATFKSAIESNPDWLIVGSFNEWVEGSYIEPSLLYGDKYMKLTKELVQDFKRR